MKVNINIRQGFDQILREMGTEKRGDIMVLRAKDRFFVGYGCEVSYSPDMPVELSGNRRYLQKSYESSLKNISLCTCRCNDD